MENYKLVMVRIAIVAAAQHIFIFLLLRLSSQGRLIHIANGSSNFNMLDTFLVSLDTIIKS